MSFGQGGGGPGNSSNKRRTHADNIPDSEKPFSCERKFLLRNLVVFTVVFYYFFFECVLLFDTIF